MTASLSSTRSRQAGNPPMPCDVQCRSERETGTGGPGQEDQGERARQTCGPRFLACEVEDEVELRAAGAGLELHHAARVSISTRSARDGKLGVLRVEERAFDRDVAVLEEGRPVALPRARRARLDADAVTLVASDLLRVGHVEDRVVESEHVAGRVTGGIDVRERVRMGMLDHMDLLAGPCAGTARNDRDGMPDRSHELCEDEQAFHLRLLLG